MREAIPERAACGRPLNEAGGFERGNRRSQIDGRRNHVGQDAVIELPADHRRNPRDLQCIGIQIVEARANDALHGVRQHERALSAGHQRVAVLDGHRLLFD